MSDQEEKVWYYGTSEGERLGPFTLQELSDFAGEGKVGPKTLLWSPGHAEWFPAERISDRLMAARLPVVPPPVPVRPQAAAELPQAAAVPPQSAVVPPPVREVVRPRVDLPEPEPSLDLKPRKASFVFSRIVLGIIGSIILGGMAVGALAAAQQPLWIAGVVAGASALLAVVSSFVGYRKERYEVHDTRVLRHSGGLLSDQTTELEIRNITHVKLRLPWLRFKFFGIGDVIVETAGNADPVVMRAIREPEAVHAGLRTRMKRNGYDLTEARLLHHEQPSMLGILSECLAAAVGLFFLALFLAGNFAAMFEEMKQAPPSWTAPLAIGLVALLLVSFITIRFLDFRRRNYRVYNDVVVYEEGFLTREHAFIPYENLADANTKQTLFDRILGLSDVQVSCQGTGKEIKFRHIRRAEMLSGAIDQLVVVAREKPKLKGGQARADGSPASKRPRRVEPERVRVAESLTGDLRMHGARTLIPALLLVPLLVGIPAMLQAVIRLSSTRYTVRPGSLRYSHRFLNVQEREFAYDKITGVVIKRNLWDRMFGTMTLRFWSIGSGQPIEFANIQAHLLDLSTLMRQAGIPDASTDPWEARPSFGPILWLRSRLKLLPVFLILSGGVVAMGMEVDPALHWLQLALAAILAATFVNDWLLCGSQRLRFHDHHVEAEQGIIAKRQYFARYANIKRTTATRYPAGGQGSLEIFVAGEEEIQQANAQQQKAGQRAMVRPCSFTTRFLPDVGGTANLLDDILSGRTDPSSGSVPAEPLETLVETKRAVPNAVIKLIILSVILVPLVVLLPLTIPFTIIAAKRWRYRVEITRIVLNRGILFRQETSILLDRVDSLQQSQGPLNKMFRNGNVTIMTAGSSKPDLTLADSPAYLELYRVIRDNSQ